MCMDPLSLFHYPATSALFPFQSFKQGVYKAASSRFSRHPYIHPQKILRGVWPHVPLWPRATDPEWQGNKQWRALQGPHFFEREGFRHGNHHSESEKQPQRDIWDQRHEGQPGVIYSAAGWRWVTGCLQMFLMHVELLPFHTNMSVCDFYRRKRKHRLHSRIFPSRFFWSVSVDGWLNPVLEAISTVQRLASHLWLQTKAKVSSKPSWNEHPGKKVRQRAALSGGIIAFLFLGGAWRGGAVNAQITTQAHNLPH